MKRLLVVGTILIAGVGLAGCGTSSSRPRLDPDVAGKPTWGGCQERSEGSFDFVADADGAPTVEAAIEHFREHGDHVVRSAPAPLHRRQWLLVDEHNVIHAALGLMRTEHGWLVDDVEKCAH
jgi:hypothetical protein